jgi:hypothetical protein
MHLRPYKLITLFLVSFLFMAQPSWAGKIAKVKGKKVYIILDAGETVNNGDSLYSTSPEGKKKGLLIVRKIKGNKVIAQLKKGRAQKGMLSMSKGAKKKATDEMGYEDASEVAKPEVETNHEKSDMLFGVMGGFGSATQQVQGIADMAGSTLAVKGIIDYSLFESLGVRARVGMDMFSLTGSNGATNYSTKINYLTVDLLLRYNLLDMKSFGLYANGGMAIYSPLSNQLEPANLPALQADSISTTSLLIVGFGVTVPMGTWKIFAGADYFYFPPSDDVKTTAIAANLGVLFEL